MENTEQLICDSQRDYLDACRCGIGEIALYRDSCSAVLRYEPLCRQDFIEESVYLGGQSVRTAWTWALPQNGQAEVGGVRP